MKCYRCDGESLPLASLTEKQASDYIKWQFVMRTCLDCGTDQNHYRKDDEPLDPKVAAMTAPQMGKDGLIRPGKQILWVEREWQRIKGLFR